MGDQDPDRAARREAVRELSRHVRNILLALGVVQVFCIATMFSAVETTPPKVERSPESDAVLEDLFQAIANYRWRSPRYRGSDEPGEAHLDDAAQQVLRLAITSDVKWGDILREENGLHTLLHRASDDHASKFLDISSESTAKAIRLLRQDDIALLWSLTPAQTFGRICDRTDPTRLMNWLDTFKLFFRPPAKAVAKEQYLGPPEVADALTTFATDSPPWLRRKDGSLLVPAFLPKVGKDGLLGQCGHDSHTPLVAMLSPKASAAWLRSIPEEKLISFIASADAKALETWITTTHPPAAFSDWVLSLTDSHSLSNLRANLQARERLRKEHKERQQNPFLDLPLGLGKVPFRHFATSSAAVILFLFFYLRLYLEELLSTFETASIEGPQTSPFPWLIQFAYSGRFLALVFVLVSATWGPVATIHLVHAFSRGDTGPVLGVEVSQLAFWAALLLAALSCLTARNFAGLRTIQLEEPKGLRVLKHVLLAAALLLLGTLAWSGSKTIEERLTRTAEPELGKESSHSRASVVP